MDLKAWLESFLEIVNNYADKFFDKLPDIIMGLVVFGIFYLVADIQKRLSRRYLHKTKVGVQKTQLINLIVRTLILLGGIVLGLTVMGVNVNTLIASLGLIGVAIGFSLRGYISNFLAGITILVQKPFKIGDEIKIEGCEGVVKEIESRFTIIETFDHREVIIPNNKFMSEAIVKYPSSEKKHYTIKLSVPSKEDLGKVKRVILTTLEGHPDVINDPEPRVVIEEFEKDSIVMKINYWSKYSKQEEDQLRSELISSIKEGFNKEGMEL